MAVYSPEIKLSHKIWPCQVLGLSGSHDLIFIFPLEGVTVAEKMGSDDDSVTLLHAL